MRRLSKSALGIAKHAIDFLPVGSGISRLVTGFYYLAHYGPLAMYSSDIVETIVLVTKLLERSGSLGKIFGGDIALKVYYLMAESRGQSFLHPPTSVPGSPCGIDTIRKVMKYCSLAVHIAYESSAVDAQRLLRLQGYTLVIASEKNSYPYFLACREKESVLIFPGTRNFGDLPIDFNAFEIEFDSYKVHKGIATTAKRVVESLTQSIQDLEKKGHSIRVVGHSLGAGIGALVT